MKARLECAIWIAAGTLAAAAIAWIAFQLQQEGVAPAVLFPSAVGGALGAALLAIARFAHAPARRVAIAGAVAWGLLAVVTQDYIGHRHNLRRYDAELAENPLGAVAGDLLPRPSFADHVQGRWRAAGVWWPLDLVLTSTAAAVVVAWGSRKRS
jgi:hypothetical protein